MINFCQEYFFKIILSFLTKVINYILYVCISKHNNSSIGNSKITTLKYYINITFVKYSQLKNKNTCKLKFSIIFANYL